MQNVIKISTIPKQIYHLAMLFERHHFRLFLVGGSVRDYLLGKIPSDFDFCTKATPNEMKAILKDYNLITIGEKYGTIGLKFNGIMCEITTFRAECDYNDNRHPSKLAFENDITQDLKRRDFSINAMAYDILERKIIDNFSGILHLKKKKISAIGEAKMRFNEDALRILRAFSLVARFNFDITQSTMEAILSQKYLLDNISKERLQAEITKILQGKFATKALKLMQKNDIFSIKIPKGFHKIPKNTRIYSAFLIFQSCPFLHNKKTKNIEKIFHMLDSKTSKIRQISTIKSLFANLGIDFMASDIQIALSLKIATNKQNRKLKKGFCPKILDSKLAISGFDLQNMGLKNENIGIVKKYLLREVYSGNLPNNKAILRRKARKLASGNFR